MEYNEYKPIMIAGSYCSGKGVLISLLDSKEILTIPQWHDMLIDIFYNFIDQYTNRSLKQNTFRGKDDRIILLRKFLSLQDYPMLEQYAIQKKIVFPISANEYEYTDFNLDFYNQSKEFFENVYALEQKEINIKNLFNLFVKSLVGNIKWLQGNKCQYFVSASEPGFFKYETLIEQYPEIKIIYINRKDWLSAYANRLKSMKMDFEHIFRDPRLNGIIMMERKALELEQEYPEQFKIIDFKNLIEDTQNTMENVCKFLDIPFSENFIKPTFFANDLKTQHLIGEVIDKEENSSLSKFEMHKVKTKYRERCAFVREECLPPEEIEFSNVEIQDMNIQDKDISIVIWNENVNDNVIKSIKNIKTLLPDAQLIFSTYNNSTMDLSCDNIVVSSLPEINTYEPLSDEICETNKNLTLIKAGLEKVNRKYTLVLQGGLLLKNLAIINNYIKFLTQNIKQEEVYRVFKNRILIDSFNTQNSEFSSLDNYGYCFHPSFLWQFGLSEDINNLFDVPMQEKFVNEIKENLFRYRTFEQYIWLSCLERNGFVFDMDSYLYNTPEMSGHSLKSILNNFFILDHKDCGIQFMEQKSNEEKEMFKFCLTTSHYYHLYKNFYDSNFKIPKYYRFDKIIDLLDIRKYCTELAEQLKSLEFIYKVPFYTGKIILKCLLNCYKFAWRIK